MYLIWFVLVRVVWNQGYVLRKCIRWKIIEQAGIGKACLQFFLMTMREIDTAADLDLEPFQTYTIELRHR